MSWLNDLKDRLYDRRMTADERTPNPASSGPKSLNLGNARKIIILFPAAEKQDRQQVEKWKATVGNPKQQITLVGLLTSPGEVANDHFTIIPATERNWYDLPQGPMTDRYLAEDCDLLLRLGPAEDRHLDYLAAAKQARLKVGPYHPERSPIYQLQFDGRTHVKLADQLKAIEAIFSFTNGKPT
ncbi:hypothetical protein [Lewinella sp. 4G2]|uniref:DUF6913 domain-containing protein n=1 Tax=Lewinella sp. 4G2 TaxID=1803372 RepID=UPI0007B4BF00|nr:hypothetical protein [Lewinella sp. 4G2]OAV43930.1 hypothetical protein A3850_005230 [Lewinella sp. 4G2]